MSDTPPTGAIGIDKAAVDALQEALAAEHAAVWCYTLIPAFLPADQVQTARSDADAHRAVRGQLEQILSDLGVQPVSAQPAYQTPKPVVDGPSAAALAVVAETDALAAWRSVVERTSDRSLRQAALDVLTKGTLRCAVWRTVVNSQPAILVFPGSA
jgi:Domain of unknown function (DUF4439)